MDYAYPTWSSGFIERVMAKAKPCIDKRHLGDGLVKTLPVHPLADLFPALPVTDYEALKADIAEQGVLTPIVLWNGKLIDGRHRMRAASELGKDFDTVTLACAEGDLPKKVAAYNLHRRHLTTGQRAAIAAEMANMGRGGDHRPPTPMDQADPLVSQSKAAQIMGVSHPSVKRAAEVIKKADDETVRALRDGAISLNTARIHIGKRDYKQPVKEPIPAELRRRPGKPRAEQFERTLSAIETHVETLTEICDEVGPTEAWLERMRAVRRNLATITHSMEKQVARVT